MKVIRKIIFYVFMSAVLLICTGITLLWIYGEEIKNQIVRNLNTQISTPIEVQRVSIDAFDHFPFVTLSFSQVKVKESFELSEQSLLKAEKVQITINPWSIIFEDYSVNSLLIYDGQLNLKKNKKGQVNYVIFKKDSHPSGRAVNYSIKKVVFENIDLKWKDDTNNMFVQAATSGLTMALTTKDSMVNLIMRGDVMSKGIQVGEVTYLEDKNINLDAGMFFNKLTNGLVIEESRSRIDGSDFIYTLSYFPEKYGDFKFMIEGSETNIQTLIALMPDKYAKELGQYKSNGNVYFDMVLDGRLNEKESPSIAIHFGLKNATLTHPQTKLKFDNMSFEGWYVSNSLTDQASAELAIRDFSGHVDGNRINGEVILKNFQDKILEFDLNGTIGMKTLHQIYPNDYFLDPEGEINMDIQFKGRINDLKEKKTAGRVNSSGQIELKQVGFKLRDYSFPMEGINGTLLFNKNNIAFDNLEGHIGQSHIGLDGTLVNIFSYLLLNDERLYVDATLKSDYLIVDELLSGGVDSTNVGGKYALRIPDQLALNIRCDVRRVDFQRFSGDQLKGMLKVKNQVVELSQVSFSEIGGKVSLNGLIDTRNDTLNIVTAVNLDNIYIDSLFYVFKDFGQDFLVQRHLSGRVQSMINASMNLTPSLELVPQSLISDISIAIVGGELKDFQPMMELVDYLPDDNLNYLKFSELKNDIHIEGEKIYIPKMEVRSNVTNITVGGVHSFNQNIEYHIVAPLINTVQIDRDKAFGAIEEDDSGMPNIHLLLIGTTDDYQVKLDKEGMKDKIVSDLKNEVLELKEAFSKKRNQEKKELTLDEDEYFDWE